MPTDLSDTSASDQEAVGKNFSPTRMQYAREKTFEAVQRIAEDIRPGITEQQAKIEVQVRLEAMGMERLWHGIIIRFGTDTLKTFDQKIDPEQVLGENDIFFIDLGVVWDGHEGDAGDTFVVGHDPDMLACAQAARTLWHDVRSVWQEQTVSGGALYDYATQRAETMGWRLNNNVPGHRISDFPHAIHRAGKLAAYPAHPTSGLWILEIQIAHPTKDFGAFYEDLLVPAD
jgi:hypothetical protein